MQLPVEAEVNSESTMRPEAVPARLNHTLLIHQAFAGPDQAGGTRHYELARRLVAKGYQFTIVASDLNYSTGERRGDGRLITEEVVDGIRVLRVWTLASLHRSFVWRVVSFLSFCATSILAAMRAGKIDLVMGTTPSIFQAASALIVAKLRRQPLLLEVRDLWPAFAVDMGILKNPVLIEMARWLERTLYNNATHLLVNSPAYRDYLLEQGIPDEKISVIPNGVEPGMFDPQARGEEIRRQYGLEDKFIVTYAGALGIANDIDTILRAARRLDSDAEIHFLMVGDGKERRNLEQKARAANLTNLTFTGAQPKHRMRDFLAASNACLATLQNIPMFRTTYPNKIFDYMAAGRPTVLAIDGVIRHVIESAGAGIFVPPGDDAELAHAVRALHASPDMCCRMGESARAYVCKYFDREQHAEAFMSLLVSTARGN